MIKIPKKQFIQIQKEAVLTKNLSFESDCFLPIKENVDVIDIIIGNVQFLRKKRRNTSARIRSEKSKWRKETIGWMKDNGYKTSEIATMLNITRKTVALLHKEYKKEADCVSDFIVSSPINLYINVTLFKKYEKIRDWVQNNPDSDLWFDGKEEYMTTLDFESFCFQMRNRSNKLDGEEK